MESSINKQQGLHRTTLYKLIYFWQPTNSYIQLNERKHPHEALCTECQKSDDQFHYMEYKSTYFAEAITFAWKRFYDSMKYYKREKNVTSNMDMHSKLGV